MIQYADAMETSPFPRLFVLDFLSDEEKAAMRTAEQPTSQNATEQPADELASESEHLCPLAAADAAGDAACAEVVLIFLLLVLGCEVIDHTV